jgi:hypothetical protein
MSNIYAHAPFRHPWLLGPNVVNVICSSIGGHIVHAWQHETCATILLLPHVCDEVLAFSNMSVSTSEFLRSIASKYTVKNDPYRAHC